MYSLFRHLCSCFPIENNSSLSAYYNHDGIGIQCIERERNADGYKTKNSNLLKVA